MKRIVTVFFVFVLSFCLPFCALASAVPQKPATEQDFYVSDNAGVLSEGTKTGIVSANQSLRSELGAEIVVVTVESTNGEDVSVYAEELGSLWGVGAKDYKNGAVMLLSVKDKTAAIVLGDGLSERTDDAQKILDEKIMPLVLEEKYDSAVLAGFPLLLTLLRESKVGGPLEYYSFVDFRENAAGGMSKNEMSGGTITAVVCFVAVVLVVIAALAFFGTKRGREGFWLFRFGKK